MKNLFFHFLFYKNHLSFIQIIQVSMVLAYGNKIAERVWLMIEYYI